MNIFFGIDPGKDGALAAIDEKGTILALKDAPMSVVKKGKGKKRVYIESAMVAMFEDVIADNGDSYALAIEGVNARPEQGVTSMFEMGMGFGLWLGIAAALKIPCTRVAPQSWKKEFGFPSGAPKGESIVRASRLFPSADLRRVKDHGRADALFIAEYLRRKASGK